MAKVMVDPKGLESVLLDSTQFLFLTLSCCGRHSIRQTRKVDVLICDEASQAIEAETLLALSLRPAKIILVGDPKQLSATLHSNDAISKHFDRSLMWTNGRADSTYHMLDTQYRMHPKISAWPSKQYYDGMLRDADEVSQKRLSCKFHVGLSR